MGEAWRSGPAQAQAPGPVPQWASVLERVWAWVSVRESLPEWVQGLAWVGAPEWGPETTHECWHAGHRMRAVRPRSLSSATS